MNVRQLIKTLCAHKDINIAQLAKLAGQTPQNLNNKLARNDMRISDLENIINHLDCRVEVIITDNEDKILYKTNI